MTTKIYKYGLNEYGSVKMPSKAKILKVAYQNGIPVVWAQVDESLPIVERLLQVVGTGWEIPEDGVYIGTCVSENKNTPLVWHVFDLGEKK